MNMADSGSCVVQSGQQRQDPSLYNSRNCVNCDSMREQYHEVLIELKSLRLINKLLLEEISKIVASEITYKIENSQCSEKDNSVQTGDNGDKGLDSENWIPVVSNRNKRTNVHMRSAFRRNQPTIVTNNNFTVIAQHEDSTACNVLLLDPRHLTVPVATIMQRNYVHHQQASHLCWIPFHGWPVPCCSVPHISCCQRCCGDCEKEERSF